MSVHPRGPFRRDNRKGDFNPGGGDESGAMCDAIQGALTSHLLSVVSSLGRARESESVRVLRMREYATLILCTITELFFVSSLSVLKRRLSFGFLNGFVFCRKVLQIYTQLRNSP